MPLHTPHIRLRQSASVRPHSTETPAGQRSFRPEIQFLRALAVMAVVVYHLNPDWLPGGYVGVDVFFVISGYLITAHMLRELESTGRLSLTQFWAARIRRILPAALVTIAISAVAAVFLLPLTQLELLAQQAMAAVFYVQNYVLAHQAVDYLAHGAMPTPFQHFWSLSVEEQFYLFWPLVAVIAMFVAKRVTGGFTTMTTATFRVLVGLAFAGIVWVSFQHSVTLVQAQDPQAYFLTTARVWELGAGGLLACVLGDPQRYARLRSVLALGGVVAISYAAVTYGPYSPDFPGTGALLPVLGTVALIAAGRTAGFLSLNPIVNLAVVRKLGDLSYSLYLWHFPVSVFYLARTEHYAQTPGSFIALLGLSLGLAVLSCRYVENPVRLNGKLKAKPLKAIGAGVVAMVLGAGVALVPQASYAYETGRLEQQAREVAQSESKNLGSGSLRSTGASAFIDNTDAMTPQPADAIEDVPLYPDCTRVPNEAADAWTGECVVANPEGTKTLVVVGDSHASQWMPAIEKVYQDTDWKIVTLLHNACPFNSAQREFEKWGELECTVPNAATQDRILEIAPERVVVANRAVNDFERQGQEQYAGTQGYIDVFEPLAQAGITVSVLSPTPEFGDQKVIPDCVALNMADPNSCGIPRDQGVENQETYHALKAAVARVKGAEFIDMTDSFCYEDWCPVVVGSVLMYRDNSHITASYMRTLNNNLAFALGMPTESEK